MASLGTWPTTIGVRSARFKPQTNQRVNASLFGGSEQAVDMLNDRWMCYLTLPLELFDAAAAVEAFLASFRGQVNTVDIWHFARPAPRGTMRGAPTLSAGVAQGAASLPIQAAAGETLYAGDMLGVSGLMLMVQTDTTADGTGAMSVPLVNRVRKALALGAAVAWDKPKAPFRLLSDTGVQYEAGITGEIDLVLGEVVS